MGVMPVMRNAMKRFLLIAALICPPALRADTLHHESLTYERVHVGTCSNSGGAKVLCLVTQKGEYLYVNLLWKKHGKVEVFMVVRKHKQTGDEKIVWMHELLRV